MNDELCKVCKGTGEKLTNCMFTASVIYEPCDHCKGLIFDPPKKKKIEMEPIIEKVIEQVI